MLNFLLCLSFIMFVLCIILLIRNNMVYRIRIKAIDYIYSFHLKKIDKGHDNPNVWNIIKEPSYIRMIFMITCWSYNSFYGNLQQRCEEIYNENL